MLCTGSGKGDLNPTAPPLGTQADPGALGGSVCRAWKASLQDLVTLLSFSSPTLTVVTVTLRGGNTLGDEEERKGDLLRSISLMRKSRPVEMKLSI